MESNPPLRLYDTSGPYTDPTFTPDLNQGLPPLRLAWILGRGDVEELPAPSSDYRQQREADPRWPPSVSSAKPLRAKPGRRVTQMHYARRGEITPEMEFIAIREGVHAGICARRGGARAGHYSGEHQSPRVRADDHRPQLPGEDQRQHR